METLIDQDAVKSLFNYSEGNLYWKIKKGRASPRDKLGYIKPNGYIACKVNQRTYRVHRLIYLYHYGFLPKYLDHINGIRHDNRIENLRECTISQNNMNSKLNKNNTSGIKGVHWDIRLKRWVVQVHCGATRKNQYFGIYKDLELAELVANEARKKYHKEFCNHG